MKKLLSIVVCLILVLSMTALLTGCGYSKIRVAEANIYGKKYIDYAKEVFFDTEEYPEMEEMGLFWTKWDEETNSIIEVSAESEEGANLIDADKPTIINVHGMSFEGIYFHENYDLNSSIANPSHFDLETEDVSMHYLWLRAGWNVGTYHYYRFSSETSPTVNESKIWSSDTPEGTIMETAGIRYQYEDRSWSDSISEYSLAEHFAADYIRAMDMLPKDMGKEEIRIAGHSMGGELIVAGVFLLTELADARQIDSLKLPNRMTLLDPYFSTTLGTSYIGPKNITISWSGNKLVDNHVGITMIECLKDIDANGIAIEYYTFHQSFLSFGVSAVKEDLIKLCVFATVDPDWQGQGYSLLVNGHNGVREWYLCSIYDDMISDITDGTESIFAPSAKMSTQLIRELKGKEFLLTQGNNTVRANDDAMVRVED